MLHAVLDTSVYRADRLRRRAGFRTLTRLCEKELIVLHVPSIVKKEFSTDIVTKAELELEQAVRAIKNLIRVGAAPHKEKVFIEQTLHGLKRLTGTFGAYAEGTFDAWLGSVRAIVHETKPEYLDDVLSKYFTGGAPFKTLKSRDDFPDAFIWQVINEIATTQGRLFAVIADKNLRQAVTSIRGVEVFKDIDSFIQSAAVQDLFPENFARKHEHEIIDVFRYRDYVLRRAFSNALRAEIVDTRILHTVEDNQDEADIVDVTVDQLTFDFGRASYFGDNVFRLPFEVELEAVLDYFIMKSTYYGLAEEDTEMLEVQDPDWNESVMWVREGRLAKTSGQLAISVDLPKLIQRSTVDRLDSDTIEYSSDITIDELDRLEVGERFSL